MKNLNTPYFIFNRKILKEEVEDLQMACKKNWNNYKIGYSIKTNSFPPLLKYFRTIGIDAEVVSEDEYNLALKVGYSSQNIICNGAVKERSWIYEILDSGALLNIDSKRELTYVCDFAQIRRSRTFNIGLRVNIDIDAHFPGETNFGYKGSRFGFSLEEGELLDAIQKLRKSPNIFISGIHLHISTKTRSTDIYRFLVRKFAEIVNRFSLKSISYFDIGGGFYGGIPGKPDWIDYLGAISQELKKHNFKPNNLKLILEPGVSIIAGSFCYYTRVIDIKKTARQKFVVLDGSRIHIDPFMHKLSYFYSIERQNLLKEKTLNRNSEQVLVGFTCLENDRFFTLTDEYSLKEGDVIRFNKVGAYTMTLTPLFISLFPAVYVKNENGDIECLRPRWTVEEFIQLSKL